jgi:hypothetical protein
MDYEHVVELTYKGIYFRQQGYPKIWYNMNMETDGGQFGTLRRKARSFYTD